MSSENVDATNVRMITEVSLRLRNLSFLISHLAEDDSTLDPERLKISLFALHRQVDALSNHLDAFGDRCWTCVKCKPAIGDQGMAAATDISLGQLCAPAHMSERASQQSTA